MNAACIAPGDIACFSPDPRRSDPPLIVTFKAPTLNRGIEVGYIDAGSTSHDSIVELDASAWRFMRLL